MALTITTGALAVKLTADKPEEIKGHLRMRGIQFKPAELRKQADGRFVYMAIGAVKEFQKPPKKK